MSVQKFHGTIETDGIKDEMGIETPSLSATGEVSGKTGIFSESVIAPAFNGKATSAGSADSATNATNATNAANDGAGNNIANTYATKAALAEETSARQSADSSLSGQITNIVNGTTTVAQATNATKIKAKDETYKALADALLEMVYPIGSIYMSVSNVSPQNFLGGTWVAWGSGRVPVGVDTSQTQFATVEQTGGEKTHTLTVDEIPSHRHPTSVNAGAGSLYDGAATGASGPSYSSQFNTAYVGGGAAHNNLQPYIVVYMWKRTA